MGASVGTGGGGGGGRRGGRRRHSAAPMAEINVTPFVDVMLVLLIVFMVAAPLMSTGVPIELPETDADALPSPTEEPVSVTIDSAGAVYLGEEPVASEELPARLAELGVDPEQDIIYIRGDTVAQHGQVMAVMGVLNKAGFRRFGLVSLANRAAEGGATQ